MKITVIAVGKLRDPAVSELIKKYEKRLPPPWRIEWKETTAARGLNKPEQIKAQEAAAILKALPPRAYVVALSEAGREMDSKAFSRWVEKILEEGRQLCFIIGGQEGLSESVLQRAEEVISLSRLTFPHELTRAILAEQIYRAVSIIRGEPYHRG